MKQQEYMDLIDRFEDSSLTLLSIETEGWKVHLEKGGSAVQPEEQIAAAKAATSIAQPHTASELVLEDRAMVQRPKTVEKGELADSCQSVKVKAPLVGTFYQAPSPADPPYAEVGSRVEKGQVLCLIEAMKMMNELKAPTDGILRAVCAEDGQLVEYGQILFEVEPC